MVKGVCNVGVGWWLVTFGYSVKLIYQMSCSASTMCVYELSFDMKMHVCYQKGGAMFDQIDFKVCI